MEVEEERRRTGGLEQRDGFAPVIACRLPQREAVEAAEARHVGGRDHRPAHEVVLVAGELAPEGGFEIGVLAHRDGSGIGERSGDLRAGIVEPVEIALAHQHGEVMVAKADRARAQLVTRGHHLDPLGLRVLVDRAQAADREVDLLARGLAFLRRVALANDHLVRQAQHGIEQAGAGRLGIVLKTQDRGEIGPAAPSQFHRIEPETGAAIG